MIQNVNGVHPELQAHSLVDREILGDREIHIRNSVSAQDGYPRVPKPADVVRFSADRIVIRASRYFECTGIEPVVDRLCPYRLDARARHNVRPPAD